MTEPSMMPTSRPTMCPGCGRPTGGGQFCGTCGLALWPGADYLAGRALPELAQVPVARAQGPRGGPSRVVVVAAAAVVLVVLIGGAVFLVQRARTPSASPPPTPAPVLPFPVPTHSFTEQPTQQPTDQFPSGPSAPTQPSVPSQPAQPTDQNTAQADLQALATTDQPQVEKLDGFWVPELSAKKPGLVANGVTYDDLSIWTDYEQQTAAHPGALLLNSSDYSTFALGGFWVTVMPQPFTNPTDANTWCANQNIDVNNCFAKLISHTAGSQGSTMPR